MQHAPTTCSAAAACLQLEMSVLKDPMHLLAVQSHLTWTSPTLHALHEQLIAAAAGSHPQNTPCTSLQCDAINGKLITEVWTIRVSFFVYVIALVTTAGWLLFMIFAGIGLVALPMDLIREFLGRPRSTISKTEYLAKAKGLGQRAKNVMVKFAWNLRMRLLLLRVCMRQSSVHPAQPHG